MKKLILSLIIGFAINSASSQNPAENDLQSMDLKGKVKSVRETCYRAIQKDGAVEKGRKFESKYYKASYIVLNDKGNKTEKSEYNADGNLYKKLTYQYNDKGNVIKEVRYNADGSVASKSQFSYKYDDKGNRIEKVWLNAAGNPEGKIIWKYDDKGNAMQADVFAGDGSVIGKETYDGMGNLLEDILYKPDGSIDWKTSYKYDEKGNCVEQTEYKGTKVLIKYLRKFDDNGNQVEIAWLKENGKQYRVYYQKYDYDQNGNWIRQTQFRQNKPTKPAYIYERELAYY